MRFEITLQGVTPPIQRVIEVPEMYTFWDLHVAIQDAMGWLDYHLHAFSPISGRGQHKSIGIPDGPYDDEYKAGWELFIADYFVRPGDEMLYEYDFGDGWYHDVILTAIELKPKKVRFPRCISGSRACPPEDCVVISGFEKLLAVLTDPSHEEYEEMNYWLMHHAKNYYPFDPGAFNPESVKFSNPKRRFEKAFGSSS
jgi:hypothetical protein